VNRVEYNEVPPKYQLCLNEGAKAHFDGLKGVYLENKYARNVKLSRLIVIMNTEASLPRYNRRAYQSK